MKLWFSCLILLNQRVGLLSGLFSNSIWSQSLHLQLLNLELKLLNCFISEWRSYLFLLLVINLSCGHLPPIEWVCPLKIALYRDSGVQNTDICVVENAVFRKSGIDRRWPLLFHCRLSSWELHSIGDLESVTEILFLLFKILDHLLQTRGLILILFIFTQSLLILLNHLFELFFIFSLSHINRDFVLNLLSGLSKPQSGDSLFVLRCNRGCAKNNWCSRVSS